MQTTATQNFQINASDYKVAIVASTFHQDLIEEYLKNTVEALLLQNIKKENIKIIRVFGALEIPYICKRIIGFRTTDIILTLGLVIRGETTHYNLVSENTYSAIMKVQLEAGTTPIGFGVLTCENFDQAKERISKTGQNKGLELANSTILQEHIVRTQL